MMNWILLVMAAIASVVVALILGGLATARTHRATRDLYFRAPIDAVWTLVRTIDETPAWCASLPAMTVLQEHAPHALTTQLLDDTGTPMGTWTLTLLAQKGGTQLSAAEEVDVRNPIQRFLRSFGAHSQRLDGFVEALGRQLGEPVNEANTAT
ncbi:hypothetical protein [Gemmatimonas phototrophica]|uniref:Polyketide cyclase n=1 Tax=Gemmatimonas phototrophica TaxID=1379270 RepID=A0A143BLX3_9BACT|nr:hypothetical protein [Gemmatimonas phototrophica]AMW06056.1 hypothetical protein GEMMAAP_17220 [Gemmatimonas phototrophica]